MSEEEVDAFLADARTIILCSNGPDGHPHPMPMWFVRDDDGAIVMTTFAKSRKVANLRQNPRVTLLAESGESYEQLRAVVVYGEAELEQDTGAVATVMARVAARYTEGAPAAESMIDALRPQATKRIRVRVLPTEIVSWDHAKLGGRY